MDLSPSPTSSSSPHPASSSKIGFPRNWVYIYENTNPDVPLIVPETPLSFDDYIVPRGLQPGENPLSDIDEPEKPALPPLDETAYSQLQEMGFPATRAEKALRITGNSSADVAMQWLFAHMDDSDIDDPYVAPASGASGPAVDEEAVTNLSGMGFEAGLAKKALQQTVLSFLMGLRVGR